MKTQNAEVLFGSWANLNGHIAVIGAFYDDDTSVHSGLAYVFIRMGTTCKKRKTFKLPRNIIYR